MDEPASLLEAGNLAEQERPPRTSESRGAKYVKRLRKMPRFDHLRSLFLYTILRGLNMPPYVDADHFQISTAR